MYRLDSNLTFPHALVPAFLLLLRTIRRALPPLSAVVEAESRTLASETLCAQSLAGGRGEGRLAEEGARSAHQSTRGNHDYDIRIAD